VSLATQGGVFASNKSIMKPIKDCIYYLYWFLEESFTIRYHQTELFHETTPLRTPPTNFYTPKPMTKDYNELFYRAKEKTVSEFSRHGLSIPNESHHLALMSSARAARILHHEELTRNWKFIGQFESGLKFILSQLSVQLPIVIPGRAESIKINEATAESIKAMKQRVLDMAQSDIYRLKNSSRTWNAENAEIITSREDIIKIYTLIPV
jgi:hypothetical protein